MNFRLREKLPVFASVLGLVLSGCSTPARPPADEAAIRPVLAGDTLLIGVVHQGYARLVAVDMDSGGEQTLGTGGLRPPREMVYASVSPDARNMFYGVRNEMARGSEQGLFVDGRWRPSALPAFANNVRWNPDSSKFVFSHPNMGSNDDTSTGPPISHLRWSIYSSATHSIVPADTSMHMSDSWWVSNDSLMFAVGHYPESFGASLLVLRTDALGPAEFSSFAPGVFLAVAADPSGNRVVVAIARAKNGLPLDECDLWLADASGHGRTKIGTYKYPNSGDFFAQWETEDSLVASVLPLRSYNKGSRGYATRINVRSGASAPLLPSGEHTSWLGARLWDGTYVVTSELNDAKLASGCPVFRIERRAADGSLVRELYRSEDRVVVFGATRGTS